MPTPEEKIHSTIGALFTANAQLEYGMEMLRKENIELKAENADLKTRLGITSQGNELPVPSAATNGADTYERDHR